MNFYNFQLMQTAHRLFLDLTTYKNSQNIIKHQDPF